MHTLKQRVAESDRHCERLAALVLELQRNCFALKNHLMAVWKDMKLFIKNFREVPIDEINHYQVLVLKYLVDDKFDEAKFEQLDSSIEAELQKSKELNKQV